MQEGELFGCTCAAVSPLPARCDAAATPGANAMMLASIATTVQTNTMWTTREDATETSPAGGMPPTGGSVPPVYRVVKGPRSTVANPDVP